MTISNYRWRLGIDKGEQKYAAYEQKMPDAQRAVMAQEVRQAVSFVAEAEEAEHVAGSDPAGAVDQE